MAEVDPKAASPKLAPVSAAERIEALDVLRGAALLGILAMNIQSYTMPGAAYFFPTAYGDLTGVNYWAWYLSEIFARRKFITIFSMLFGAGIVLMQDRASATGRGWAGVHYRRMGVLWLFGMLHAYLLWEGDILVCYAICGLFLYLFRKVRTSRLLATGVVFLIFGSVTSLFFGWSAQYWPPESLEEFRNSWQPNLEELTTEISNMQGGWRSEIHHRAPSVLMIHIFYLPTHLIWRAGGCMLLGMAFFRWGWFSAQRSRRFYRSLIALALLVGLPLTIYGVHSQKASGWEPVFSFFMASQYNYWGSLPMAMGWVGAVMLLFRSSAWRSLVQRLAAVGRMALTNYLMQTIICTTLVCGHGFGKFSQLERREQACLVLAIWVIQMTYSHTWLKHYRFGPAEWLWRSLSYRQRQPFRR